MRKKPRVAIVHDYLTQLGGAERVVLSMLKAFPDARVYTSFYDADATYPDFERYDIRPSPLNRLPVLRRDPRRAALLMPFVFGRLRIDADVVVASTSGWSHGVRTSGSLLVYCHTPARWLYEPQDYFRNAPFLEHVLAPLLKSWRRWDLRAAQRASAYAGISRAVIDRIWRAYALTARRIPPPAADLTRLEPEPLPGLSPGYFLTVGRARGYKNIDAVVAAFRDLPAERLVVVGDVIEADSVKGVGGVNDQQLAWLYRNCKGLIAASHEDFGLTPLEANAFGRPVLALRAGGFLDTVREGVNGEFFDRPTPAVIREAVRGFATTWDEEAIKAHAVKYSDTAFVKELRKWVDSAEVVASDRVDDLQRSEQ